MWEWTDEVGTSLVLKDRGSEKCLGAISQFSKGTNLLVVWGKKNPIFKKPTGFWCPLGYRSWLAVSSISRSRSFISFSAVLAFVFR